MTTSDDRLRAAHAANAERERLIQTRSQHATELTAAQQQVQQLARALGKELSDVQQLSTGVQGFLNQLVGGERLAKEQREVFDADARYKQAMQWRDQVIGNIANIDSRLAVLSTDAIATEIREARASKELEIRNAGGARAGQLLELDIRLESIDIELIPLENALTSGHAALAKLAEIVTFLDSAQDDRDSKKRAGASGDAQTKLIAFRRALDELASGGLDPVFDRRPDERFADSWVRALFGDGKFAGRLAAARASILERIDYVRTKLTDVRTRFDELSARRASVAQERDALVMSA
ncbi:MAG: hypothetical protein ABI867_36690 [Kofleriaceae bacterium]